jgi:hypothetical protein
MPKYLMVKEVSEDEAGIVHHHVHHHHHNGEAKDVTDSKYSGAITEVMEELAEHPKEWVAYGTTLPGLMQIVGLEYAQLQAAKNDSDHRQIKEELADLAAACIHAYTNM